MDTNDSDCRPHITSKKRWSRWKMRMMTKMRICDRWAEYCYYISLSIHGTARFWAAKRGAFRMHALMTGALGTSKQAMHRGELGKHEDWRWVFNSVLRLLRGLYSMIAWPLQIPQRKVRVRT